MATTNEVAKLFRKIKRYLADDIEADKKDVAITIASLLYDLGRDAELNVLHYGTVFATNWAKGIKWPRHHVWCSFCKCVQCVHLFFIYFG